MVMGYLSSVHNISHTGGRLELLRDEIDKLGYVVHCGYSYFWDRKATYGLAGSENVVSMVHLSVVNQSD